MYFAFNEYVMKHISSKHVVKNLAQILQSIPFVNRPNCEELRKLFDDWFIKYYTRTRLYFLLKSWKPKMRGKAKFLNIMDYNPDHFVNEEYIDELFDNDDRIELDQNGIGEPDEEYLDESC